MSLELDPPELGFARKLIQRPLLIRVFPDQSGPCDREVVNYLKLSNPHREPIAFKVRSYGASNQRTVN